MNTVLLLALSVWNHALHTSDTAFLSSWRVRKTKTSSSTSSGKEQEEEEEEEQEQEEGISSSSSLSGLSGVDSVAADFFLSRDRLSHLSVLSFFFFPVVLLPRLLPSPPCSSTIVLLIISKDQSGSTRKTVWLSLPAAAVAADDPVVCFLFQPATAAAAALTVWQKKKKKKLQNNNNIVVTLQDFSNVHKSRTMFATTVTSASKLSSKLSFPLASFFHKLQQTHKTHNTPSAEASSTLSESCKLHNSFTRLPASQQLKAGWLAFKLKPTQRSNPSPNAAAHSQT
jgi:hypothetical protein